MTMWRHEFLESLVRIAIAKYKLIDPNLRPHEALDRLIGEILSNWSPLPAQEFRDKYLWTNGCDLLLKANEQSIRKIHAHFFPKD
jgi:hypothetical protein